MKKYFEYTGPDSENKSGAASKFWEVTVDGSKLNIRFGKIGVANGQTTVKEFDSNEEALVQVEKLIKEKTKKGYVERKRVMTPGSNLRIERQLAQDLGLRGAPNWKGRTMSNSEIYDAGWREAMELVAKTIAEMRDTLHYSNNTLDEVEERLGIGIFGDDSE